MGKLIGAKKCAFSFDNLLANPCYARAHPVQIVQPEPFEALILQDHAHH